MIVFGAFWILISMRNVRSQAKDARSTEAACELET